MEKLRKPKKYKAYNGDNLIGTTFAIDSARLLAETFGDRIKFKRNGEIVEEMVTIGRILIFDIA